MGILRFESFLVYRLSLLNPAANATKIDKFSAQNFIAELLYFWILVSLTSDRETKCALPKGKRVRRFHLTFSFNGSRTSDSILPS
jgi:hypothetical protein